MATEGYPKIAQMLDKHMFALSADPGPPLPNY